MLVRPVLSLIQGSQWTYLSPIHVLWDQLTLMLTTGRARWQICRLCTLLYLQAIFQVEELVGWVEKSNADFVILGGDFNTDPKDNETSYHSLKQVMTSSMEEFFLDIKVTYFYFYCQKL